MIYLLENTFPLVLKGRYFIKVLVTQLWSTLFDPMGCSLPGSSVHGKLQARVLKLVANSFSRYFIKSLVKQPIMRLFYFLLTSVSYPYLEFKIISLYLKGEKFPIFLFLLILQKNKNKSLTLIRVNYLARDPVIHFYMYRQPLIEN